MRSIAQVALFFSLFLWGCTVYTEKQTEPVSQAVYATKDSIDAARIDLADQYISQATKLIIPPKQRIPISAVYEKKQAALKTKHTNQRVVIVPSKYNNSDIVVVGSK